MTGDGWRVLINGSDGYIIAATTKRYFSSISTSSTGLLPIFSMPRSSTGSDMKSWFFRTKG